MTGTTEEVQKTPEELAQEEIAAQADDMAEAIKHDTGPLMPNPPEPFVEIKRNFGPGFVAYETKRGLVKALQDELICKVHYDAVPEVLEDVKDPETGETTQKPKQEEDVFVCTAGTLKAVAGIDADALPMPLAKRALLIGEARRAAGISGGTAPSLPSGGGTSPAPQPANPATGANSGTPGSYSPMGATAPADLAGLASLTANPTSAWLTGRYVVLGDASEAHWDGSGWVAGRA